MIVVHEGLPRSGKSYEAVVRRIIPAIVSGRRVFTNIEGVDHARIAEVTELPLERVQELLSVLTPEQLARLWDVDMKNALLVLDEVQNTWGVKAKMPPEMVKFVAEHGHHGIDVVLMSQDIKDIHVIWRRRIEVRQVTLKLSAIGKPTSYSVTTYRGKGSELYEKVGTKIIKYDPKYFGTYKSYSDTDVSTAVLADDRASVWHTDLFQKIIPTVVVATVAALWFLWGYFHPDEAPAAPPAAPARVVAAAPASVPAAPAVHGPVAPAEVARARAAAANAELLVHPLTATLKALTEKGRPRLAAVLVGRGGRTDGTVEWTADGGRVQHRFTFRQLREMGVTVDVLGEAGVRLRSGPDVWVVTAWPTDEPLGRVTNHQAAQVTVASLGAGAQPVSPHAAGVPVAGAVQAAPADKSPASPVSQGRPSQDRDADLVMIETATKRPPLQRIR